MAHAWIGLGSNLNDPEQQLKTALVELGDLPSTQLLKASRLWISKPLGPQDQPDFINAAALLDTQLLPLDLLDQLQALEQAHQRVRKQHWGPRTLDLDLLLYDQLQLDHPRLQLPHPQMHLRPFVLEPLMELDSHLELPEHGRLADLVERLNSGNTLKTVLPLEAKMPS
ncbi:2-amino-4-hydroxy-6-hydroxymethyldihydropteridinediphosphokinase [Marinospirillum celere]|uniref:2-amino-4-hydroxy-6-hydroxymethyldihydropteridine pyrophosphokinase n=1 Tax=Marinospirillum celere TaxID=1122252 RepID=A0A1I1IEG3_9GAMM|nr:2-amino-4-hydroxy-6-hydroxymethyldihydropteridine diphosphokinase [Marinospirillum celere]SFC34072.1 2-amino-4-hydroxy-6-hydroxymethyldihydropteridinediphosphokinase [Marinospirillum celere]